jgi:KDO2-lipid IV(A) lauroyltransferase
MVKFLCLLIASKLFAPLPDAVLYGLARAGGTLAYYLNRSGRRAVLANCRRIMPEAGEAEQQRVARAVFGNVGMLYADLIRIPRLDLDRFWAGHIEVHGWEKLTNAYRQRRGVVLASIHYGSFEVVMPFLHYSRLQGFALSEPLKPPALNRLVHKLRNRHAAAYRPVSYGTIRAAHRSLRRGQIVVVAADRDIQKTGRPVEFFGSAAWMPTGAVQMALTSGAALLPAIARRKSATCHMIDIGDEIELQRTGHKVQDIESNMRRLLAVFEAQIRRDPSQWVVLEPLWSGERKQD